MQLPRRAWLAVPVVAILVLSVLLFFGRVERARPSPAAVYEEAAAFERAQNYAEAVMAWSRYISLTLPADLRAEGERRLGDARDLFVRHYDIAEHLASTTDNIVPLEVERAWASEFASEVTTRTPALADPAITAYLRGLCQALVTHAPGFPAEYRLIILDTGPLNAHAFIGLIVVNRGVLEAVESENELAGVIGHEIGHAIARHAGKAYTKALADYEQMEALRRQGTLSPAEAARLSAGARSTLLAFSREEEAQADRLGTHIAFDSGHDPAGLVTLLSRQATRLSVREGDESSTHPATADRVQALTEYCRLFPSRVYQQGGAPFNAMKARLRELTPAG